MKRDPLIFSAEDKDELELRASELEKARLAGKVWVRGDSLDGLDPTLRVFIEKRHNPTISYPLIPVPNEHP